MHVTFDICYPAVGNDKDAFYNYLQQFSECKELPRNARINGRALPAGATAGFMVDGLKWLAMAFESVSGSNTLLFSHSAGCWPQHCLLFVPMILLGSDL